jgi:hypothetical protein
MPLDIKESVDAMAVVREMTRSAILEEMVRDKLRGTRFEPRPESKTWTGCSHGLTFHPGCTDKPENSESEPKPAETTLQDAPGSADGNSGEV